MVQGDADEELNRDVERAMALLGPLEGRVMRAVWTGEVAETFVVRDVQALMPKLAYTTVMTTLRRLADKGLLVADATVGKRAYDYRSAGTPEAFLAAASQREAQQVLDRYGDAALAAFAARLDALTPEQRKRLEELEGR
jgi:predicted transcriptional regulator